MNNLRKFLTDVAEASHYGEACKLLGMVVFVAEKGMDPLLLGRLVSSVGL